MTKRKTIREKKVAVIQMLVNSMEESLKNMNNDLEKLSGKVLEAFLDAHFEKLRCNSGNLNLVLENNRLTLSIMYESVLIDARVASIEEQMAEDAKK